MVDLSARCWSTAGDGRRSRPVRSATPSSRRKPRSLGIRTVRNFYGMVEQVGGVFLEGDDGLLHPPPFADVIVRDPVTWRPQPVGRQGVVQVISPLPTSYPGHCLLTEDLGTIVSVDDPGSGLGGKGLVLQGRVPRTELRGCSDTHARRAGAV